MDIRKLQRAIVNGLEDVKAQNIRVFNTEHLSPLFERVVVASGTSNRQTKALAASVRDSVKQQDLAVLRTEGEENGEWIIVDCGAAVVHIMQPAIREYYHLEEIWGDKPVRLKGEPAARAVAKKVAVKKVVVKKVVAPKTVAKKTVAKKTVAKKTVAKKTTTPKRVTRTPATKKPSR
jgi:ribosome-associated protein